VIFVGQVSNLRPIFNRPSDLSPNPVCVSRTIVVQVASLRRIDNPPLDPPTHPRRASRTILTPGAFS